MQPVSRHGRSSAVAAVTITDEDPRAIFGELAQDKLAFLPHIAIGAAQDIEPEFAGIYAREFQRFKQRADAVVSGFGI